MDSNYTLQKESQAISHGMNLGYTSDILNNLVGNPPDVGALAYAEVVSVDAETDNNYETDDFGLFNNYPNPFNSSTKIKFRLAKENHVILKIYNSIGQEIDVLVNKILPIGIYELDYSPSDLTSGVYLYTITAGNSYATKKMILLE